MYRPPTFCTRRRKSSAGRRFSRSSEANEDVTGLSGHSSRSSRPYRASLRHRRRRYSEHRPSRICACKEGPLIPAAMTKQVVGQGLLMNPSGCVERSGTMYDCFSDPARKNVMKPAPWPRPDGWRRQGISLPSSRRAGRQGSRSRPRPCGFLAATKFDAEFTDRGAHAGAEAQKVSNSLIGAAQRRSQYARPAQTRKRRPRVTVGTPEAGSGRNLIPEHGGCALQNQRGEHSRQ